MFFFRFKGGC